MRARAKRLLLSSLVVAFSVGLSPWVQAQEVSSSVALGRRLHQVATQTNARSGLDGAPFRAVSVARIRRLLASRPPDVSPAIDLSSVEVPSLGSGRRFGLANVQAPATQPASSGGGRNLAGPLAATAAGAALLVYFLAGGSSETEEMGEARDTRREILDFTMFAGAVSLLSAGVVMLVVG